MSVTTKPFWHNEGNHQPLVKCVSNIESSYKGDSNKNGVFIDSYIAKFISDLNKHSLITTWSCSGIQSDHKEALNVKGPYFIIVINQNNFKLATDYIWWVKVNLKEIRINSFGEGVAFYLTKDIDSRTNESDYVIKCKWNKLHRGLREILTKKV